MSPAIRSRLALITGVILLVATQPALAQMVPLHDHREIHASATYGGIVSEDTHVPAAPFAYFENYADMHAETENGAAQAFAFQSSQFYPAGIYASGTSGGGWSGVPSGSYETHVLTYFRFRVDGCITYDLDATMTPGDVSELGVTDGHITLGSYLGPTYFHLENGHAAPTGRLAPGTYWIEGRSRVDSEAQGHEGPTYGLIWNCAACSSSLIASHPTSATVAAGGTVQFTVVPASGPRSQDSGLQSPAYQWRMNLVPISDGGHYAGTTTSSLTISSASAADTGFYDVVLTEGEIVEPSSLAHLALSGTVGVGDGPLAPGPVTVGMAIPNPSRSSTSFVYSVRNNAPALATIYDAAGRVVRPVADRTLSGSGTLAWDGRTAAGELAPPGIYFLRVDAGGQSIVRRFVRMR